jgi:hypothetical protein
VFVTDYFFSCYTLVKLLPQYGKKGQRKSTLKKNPSFLYSLETKEKFMPIRLITLTIILSFGLFFKNISMAATHGDDLTPGLVFSGIYQDFTLQSFREEDREAVTAYLSGVTHDGVTAQDKLDETLNSQLIQIQMGNPFAWTIVWLKEEIVGILQMGAQRVTMYPDTEDNKTLTAAFTALIGVSYTDADMGDGDLLVPELGSLKTGIGTCPLAIRPEHYKYAPTILEAGFLWFENFKDYALTQRNPRPSVVSAIIDPTLKEYYKAAGFTVLTDKRWHSFYGVPRHFAVREIPGASTHAIDWEALGPQL